MIIFEGKTYHIQDDMSEDATKALDQYCNILQELENAHKERVDKVKANLVHTLSFYSK